MREAAQIPVGKLPAPGRLHRPPLPRRQGRDLSRANWDPRTPRHQRQSWHARLEKLKAASLPGRFFAANRRRLAKSPHSCGYITSQTWAVAHALMRMVAQPAPSQSLVARVVLTWLRDATNNGCGSQLVVEDAHGTRQHIALIPGAPGRRIREVSRKLVRELGFMRPTLANAGLGASGGHASWKSHATPASWHATSPTCCGSTSRTRAGNSPSWRRPAW